MFDYVFCCMPEEQQTALRSPNANLEYVRRMQENLMKEKHGYRCSKCGRFIPAVQLLFRDTAEDGQLYARLPRKAYRYKKAADVFCGSHYYAKNSNALLKFEVDAEHTARQTDSIPIRRDACYIVLSPDEKYIATENFSGTIDVIDAQTKLPVARRQRTDTNGAFIFTPDHKLLYFFKAAIRCWDFLAGQDTVLFPMPELWLRGDKPGETFPFSCHGITYHADEDVYRFVCTTRKKTYVVTIRDGKFAQVVQLPRTPWLGRLIYAETLNQYTFSDGNDVILYDADFRVAEQFAPPQIVELRDSKMLPLMRFTHHFPSRTFISPDGKWLLLDYTFAILLMTRESREFRFCLASMHSKPRQMGFLDNDHFWYTMGDSTYVQPI